MKERISILSLVILSQAMEFSLVRINDGSFKKEFFMLVTHEFLRDLEEKFLDQGRNIEDKKSMDDPILSPFPFMYFTAARDPLEDEPTIDYEQYAELVLFWWNTDNKDFYICTDKTQAALVWEKFSTSRNMPLSSPTFIGLNLSGLDASQPIVTDGSKNLANQTYANFKSAMGLNVNAARAPSSVTPPSFNVSRQPNTTHDVFVSANIVFAGVLSISAEVDIQTSTNNSTWITQGKAQQQLNLGGQVTQQLYVLVPAGSYYRFTLTGSGATIDSILETTL